MVNAGYASVSYFILLSGFVLAYNYAARARAGELDTRALLEGALHAALSHLFAEPAAGLARVAAGVRAHTHAMFWTGMVLSPLLLQGWIPEIATFLNTPAWTMSAESFYYVHLSLDGAMEEALTASGRTCGSWRGVDARARPRHALHHLQSRWNSASRPLELWPLAAGAQIHASSASGQLHLRRAAGRTGRSDAQARMRLRLLLGIFGFGGIILHPGVGLVPYAASSRRPADAALRLHHLGLPAKICWRTRIGSRPLVFVGEASYCLYLLHFNMWNLIHDTHVLDRARP